jgi:hypothetical protein
MRKNKMENEKKLLPVGSVVYLKEGTLKLVVLSRGELVLVHKDDEKSVYFDYMGGIYPQGNDPENNYYFNHEDIEKVIFKGYIDEDENRYLEVLRAAKENNKNSYITEKTEEVLANKEAKGK